MKPEDDDIAIIGNVLNGNIEEYEVLVERYKLRIFSILGKRLPVHDIGEAANETFIRAFNNLVTYAGKKPFGNWISSIAFRVSCDYWRKREKEISLNTVPSFEERDKYIEWLDNAGKCHSIEDFERECGKKEAKEVLDIVLISLAPEDRILIELIYLDDCPLAEAAGLMGWGLSKTKVRSMRAKMKLRRIVNKLVHGGTL